MFYPLQLHSFLLRFALNAIGFNVSENAPPGSTKHPSGFSSALHLSAKKQKQRQETRQQANMPEAPRKTCKTQQRDWRNCLSSFSTVTVISMAVRLDSAKTLDPESIDHQRVRSKDCQKEKVFVSNDVHMSPFKGRVSNASFKGFSIQDAAATAQLLGG